MASISKQLKEGRKKATALVSAQLTEAMTKYAKQAVIDAVYNYSRDHDTSNLTGNTIAGFTSALYVDGKIVCHFNALEVTGINEPTSGYTFPHDSELQDYDSGEMISKRNAENYFGDPMEVYNYRQGGGGKFRATNAGGNAIDDTLNWLMKQHPKKSYITVIVANVSPYVNYLHTSRNFDILDTMSEEAKVRKDVVYQLLHTRLLESTGERRSSSNKMPDFDALFGNSFYNK